MFKISVFLVTFSVAMNAGSVASFKIAVGNDACVELDVRLCYRRFQTAAARLGGFVGWNAGDALGPVSEKDG